MFFDFVPEFKYFLQLNLTMAWSQLFKTFSNDEAIIKLTPSKGQP